jgi:hypothetical protein
MEKQKCQICGYENVITEVECGRCHWPISADSTEIREEKILKWAQQIYKLWCTSEHNLQQLRKQNTNSINSSSSVLEKSLQSLLSYQASQIKLLQEQNNFLGKLFTEVSDIKEQFISNYYVYPVVAFKQEENQETLNTNAEEDSHTQFYENDPGNLVNTEIIQLNENPEYQELLDYYNNKEDFPNKIEIVETIESKSQRMNGNQINPIFERKERGDYLLINGTYLAPKYHHKINSHSYQTFSTLFECRNYEQSTKENFRLIKPGKVNWLNNQETWQLEERGIIEFS